MSPKRTTPTPHHLASRSAHPSRSAGSAYADASLRSDEDALSAYDGAPDKGAAQHVEVLFVEDADIEGGVSGLHGDLELRVNPPSVADGFAL